LTCSDRSVNPEPFQDDRLDITIRNNLPSRIVLDAVKYDIETQSDGKVTSGNIAVVGNAKGADPEADVTFSTLLFRAYDGSKFFADPQQTKISDESFGNLNVTVYGHDAFGKPVSSTASIALSFGNFNLCALGTRSVPTTVTARQIEEICPQTASPTAVP
jgi:hypothetical protein